MLTPDVGKARQTYTAAGVDISAATRAKELIKKQARSTFSPQVVSDIGFFGALFEFKGYREPLLVSSVDGVGTKLKVAAALGKYNSVGIDIVNHCVNDILTCGAAPLFFLDYIAMGKLVPEQVEKVVQGIAEACRDVGCALVGGETAEMPGVYAAGDYDLVGFIVGVVEKKSLIDGSNIRETDVLLGLPSSGLHTNGYSLARKVFGVEPAKLQTYCPELGRTLAEELLEPHRCYYPRLREVLPLVKGLAHITGGGLVDNVPRVLPPGLAARFNPGSWTVLPIFRLIQQCGSIDNPEMYRVFNMGIGMVIVCSPDRVGTFTKIIPEARVVGEVIKQRGAERVILD